MEELRAVLLERVSLINDLFTDYQNNPYEAERAHKLRVHIRELRAVINFFKKGMPEEDYKLIKDSLKEVAQFYGPVRDLDVLTDYISRISLDYPDLSNAYYGLFRELENARCNEMRKTMNANRRDKIQSLLNEVTHQLEGLDLELDQDFDAYISKKLKKKVKKLKAAYDGIDYDHYEDTHNIRIQAKRVRYAASILDDFTSQNLSKYVKKAKKIQNELGHIVDYHVNQNLLTEFSEKVDDTEVKKLIEEIQKLEI